jgi:hypothetical protein
MVFKPCLGDENLMGITPGSDFNTIGTWIHKVIGLSWEQESEWTWRSLLEHIMGKLWFGRWAVYLLPHMKNRWTVNIYYPPSQHRSGSWDLFWLAGFVLIGGGVL